MIRTLSMIGSGNLGNMIFKGWKSNILDIIRYYERKYLGSNHHINCKLLFEIGITIIIIKHNIYLAIQQLHFQLLTIPPQHPLLQLLLYFMLLALDTTWITVKWRTIIVKKHMYIIWVKWTTKLCFRNCPKLAK